MGRVVQRLRRSLTGGWWHRPPAVSRFGWDRRARPGAGVAGAAAGGSGFVVVDVETTGLDSAVDRVVEVALVGTDAWGGVRWEWSTRVNPDGPVGASEVHGITAADVAGAPRFPDLIPELTARLSGAVVVAHHAAFDVGFLTAEYARAGRVLPEVAVVCTYRASTHFLPGLARRRLADCCAAAGVPLVDAHTAVGDARATAALLAFYLTPRERVTPGPGDVGLLARAAAGCGLAGPVASRSGRPGTAVSARGLSRS